VLILLGLKHHRCPCTKTLDSDLVKKEDSRAPIFLLL